MGPATAGSGQSRAYRRERESAFRGHLPECRAMVCPKLVRRNVLRQRRYGESDQGAVHLFADRVSAETMRANQLRLYLSVMAYVLVSGLRRLGLKATELAQAQVSTIRTKLLKIGAQVRVTVRKVWVSMASSCPWQE